MKPKYQMTVEQNIFVAKRNIIDYIWKSVKLEGFAVTYPDTEAIFNGLSVPGIKVNEIVGVNNLKHAWQFILDNLDYQIDFSYICKINQLVGGDNLIVQAGYLRKVPVSSGGTTWRPDMPDETQIKEELSAFLAVESPTERAITLMLYLMRKQMFLDGNKRTAMLSANQVMISSGCGVISIPIEHQRAFTGLLVHYYETNDMEELKAFMYEYCIDGIQFDPIHETDRPAPDEEEMEP
ncbi:Fic family protein [Paenibacillus sp. YN15]|uniref:Fic family protein n=1 Tax=Paenibacillus sp. YN15 TaxID=1742774 RepID=UPI000DCF248A|nr:Fic family protein [Paenibacillus sp. YN15]RAU97624.1 cell filamentation protein Fic [Paenibacillus sp. YN15]